MSSSLAAYLNAWLLYRALRREEVYRPEPGWWRLMLQVGFANAVMAALLWWGAADWSVWMAWRGSQRIMYLLLLVGAGAAAYFAWLWLTGVRYHHFRQKAK